MQEDDPTVDGRSAADRVNTEDGDKAQRPEVSSTLSYRFTPGYIVRGLLILAGVGLLWSILLQGALSVFVMVGAILLFLALTSLVTRGVSWTIDPQTDRFTYARGGLLGTRYLRDECRYHAQDIVQIRMKRYRSRYRDTFQVFIVLLDGTELPASATRLDFVECHELTSQLQEVLGKRVAVVAQN